MTDPTATWFQRALAALLDRPGKTATKLNGARSPHRRVASSTRHHATRAERVRRRKAQHQARRKQR